MNKKEMNNLIDPFDSIKEWIYCLRNYIELPNIDLNKNKKELIEMIENILEEIEEL